MGSEATTHDDVHSHGIQRDGSGIRGTGNLGRGFWASGPGVRHFVCADRGPKIRTLDEVPLGHRKKAPDIASSLQILVGSHGGRAFLLMRLGDDFASLVFLSWVPLLTADVRRSILQCR